jgi:hypothetical protein
MNKTTNAVCELSVCTVLRDELQDEMSHRVCVECAILILSRSWQVVTHPQQSPANEQRAMSLKWWASRMKGQITPRNTEKGLKKRGGDFLSDKFAVNTQTLPRRLKGSGRRLIGPAQLELITAVVWSLSLSVGVTSG